MSAVVVVASEKPLSIVTIPFFTRVGVFIPGITDKVDFHSLSFAFDASEVGCYRYAGNDRTIMNRIGLDYCDQAGPLPVVFAAAPDDDPAEFHFSLSASKGRSIDAVVKDIVSRISLLFKWR